MMLQLMKRIFCCIFEGHDKIAVTWVVHIIYTTATVNIILIKIVYLRQQ